MRYHKIQKDDCLNGNGIRVSLFVSGCDFHCKGCQNPQTWDINSGKPFTENTLKVLINELNHDYVQGLTLLGGEPLHQNNLETINMIIDNIHSKNFTKNKDVWIYSGYTFEEIMKNDILKETIFKCDVLVDGRYVEELKDQNYHWAGSTNQRVIDIKKTLLLGEISLWNN